MATRGRWLRVYIEVETTEAFDLHSEEDAGDMLDRIQAEVENCVSIGEIEEGCELIDFTVSQDRS